jgi:hypothetical protein
MIYSFQQKIIRKKATTASLIAIESADEVKPLLKW